MELENDNNFNFTSEQFLEYIKNKHQKLREDMIKTENQVYFYRVKQAEALGGIEVAEQYILKKNIQLVLPRLYIAFGFEQKGKYNQSISNLEQVVKLCINMNLESEKLNQVQMLYENLKDFQLKCYEDFQKFCKEVDINITLCLNSIVPTHVDEKQVEELGKIKETVKKNIDDLHSKKDQKQQQQKKNQISQSIDELEQYSNKLDIVYNQWKKNFCCGSNFTELQKTYSFDFERIIRIFY